LVIIFRKNNNNNKELLSFRSGFESHNKDVQRFTIETPTSVPAPPSLKSVKLVTHENSGSETHLSYDFNN
jgi:hypothetical protein